METTNQEAQSPKKEIKQHWDQVAKSWYIPKDSLPAQQYDEALQRELTEVVGKSARVTLDIGTGANCRLARSFAKLGHESTAVDVSDKMLSGAKQSSRERDLQINLIQSWAHELPFLDDAFDAVATRGLFWTLPDPEVAIQEWIRITKNGGHIVIYELEGLRGFKGYKFDLMVAYVHLKNRIRNLGSPTTGYSKETSKKLRYARVHKRMTMKEWEKYLSNFPVTHIEVKKSQKEAGTKKIFPNVFGPVVPLMINCVVQKAG